MISDLRRARFFQSRSKRRMGEKTMRSVKAMMLVFLCLLAGVALAQAPQGVTVDKDVVYGHSDGVDLKMDLAKPAPSAGKAKAQPEPRAKRGK